MEEIMVSIICNTYNHEQYIADALNSFVNQKTNFKFEVLVHDDASTDNTQSIIKVFEKKYPDIVKPIYQKENQYSKGIYATRAYQLPRAKGKYIAFCEGDDYWTDMNKLQICVDFLENHPDYGAVCHDTVFHNCVSGSETLLGLGKGDKEYSIEDAFSNKCHTSSFFFKKDFIFIWPKYRSAFPKVGDWPLKLLLCDKTKVFYFGKPMSFYRYLSNDNSASSIFNGIDNKKRFIEHYTNCSNLMYWFEKECSKINKRKAKHQKYLFYRQLIRSGGSLLQYKRLSYCLMYIPYKLYLFLN